MIEKKIKIPDNVEIEINKMTVSVKGEKGSITKNFGNPKFNKFVNIEKNNNEILISTNSEKRKIKAIVKTIHSHIINMIRGVTYGFRYEMKIVYTHFPITVTVKDREIQIKNFLGEKGIRKAKIVGNVDVKIEKDTIILTGINIEDVGQTSANIEHSCKLTKRDRRIFVDGIYTTGKFLQNGEAL